MEHKIIKTNTYIREYLVLIAIAMGVIFFSFLFPYAGFGKNCNFVITVVIYLVKKIFLKKVRLSLKTFKRILVGFMVVT